jgi:hypothetical protein
VSNRVRNRDGVGKAVTFNVITPMNRFGTLVVRLLLWFFDANDWTQATARDLRFLSFVHWVVVSRDQLSRIGDQGGKDRVPKEQTKYDYLFFLSTFNGPWGPYVEAYSDVLYKALDLVWFWSVGYPFARPVNGLIRYIHRNEFESDHCYSAYPGASVRDVGSALALRAELRALAAQAPQLSPESFRSEFDRLLMRTENMLGSFGPH